MTRLESLERLVRLRDAGALTEEEFANEKAKILAKDEQTSSPVEEISASSKKGQRAVAETVQAFRQEPRPTFQEALAEGRKASKPTRNVIRIIALSALIGVLSIGLLFWLVSEREPDSLGHALEESGATMATSPTTDSSQQPATIGDGSSQLGSRSEGDSLASDIHPRDLVGVWDWDDGFCTNAESVHIDADGTYSDGFSDGTWSLVGNTVILLIQGYDMQDGSGRPAPERLEFTVAQETPNIFSLRSMDGQARRLLRCEYRDGAQVQYQ